MLCWNFDLIVGTIAPGATISFKTDKGKVSITPGKIVMVSSVHLTMKGHSDRAFSVAFSPDGKRVASGSFDRVRIWDAVTGRGILTLTNPTSRDRPVSIWETVTGRRLGRDGFLAWSVAFSPDGKRIASGGMIGTIKIWDVLNWAKGPK